MLKNPMCGIYSNIYAFLLMHWINLTGDSNIAASGVMSISVSWVSATISVRVIKKMKTVNFRRKQGHNYC